MYELKVTSHFAAAHNLREFYGRCENLHGHNWFVEAVVRAKGLDDIGLAMDFGVVKKRLNEVLDELDHKYLNELGEFKVKNPSSENIARFIFDRLAPLIAGGSGGRARLHSVSAWESDNACARYVSDDLG
ncbi:MAG: 6-carboxytetrahydropterin synthase QueD [Deltaproteobacteria bacterium]|jgi:6-pyruvoyltetrahydropterin/6-carboxytetrahydropterin synthase|nr:6-carboxytetrahydropterin synthase QueD [Deltaproteobacteria bacterium]